MCNMDEFLNWFDFGEYYGYLCLNTIEIYLVDCSSTCTKHNDTYLFSAHTTDFALFHCNATELRNWLCALFANIITHMPMRLCRTCYSHFKTHSVLTTQYFFFFKIFATQFDHTIWLTINCSHQIVTKVFRMWFCEAHSIEFRAGEIGALDPIDGTKHFHVAQKLKKLFVSPQLYCIDKLTSSVKCN